MWHVWNKDVDNSDIHGTDVNILLWSHQSVLYHNDWLCILWSHCHGFVDRLSTSSTRPLKRLLRRGRNQRSGCQHIWNKDVVHVNDHFRSRKCVLEYKISMEIFDCSQNAHFMLVAYLTLPQILRYLHVYHWPIQSIDDTYISYIKLGLEVTKHTEWQKQSSTKCARRVSITAVISSGANCQ